MADRLRVTRNQLAAFIPDFETIKQFEKLIGLVDAFSATEVDELESASASARATQALDLINALSKAFALLSTAPARPQQEQVDYIDFNISAHVDRIRRLAWDNTDGTLNLGHSGGVVQQVGQNMYLFAINNTGSTINKGTAVGFAGVNGLERIEIAPYLADGSTNSLYFIGVTAQDFPDGGTGRVTVFGRVENIDTSAFSLGDLLWADPINAGGLTATKPTAPNNVISVAAVLEDDASTGQIFVRPTIDQQKFYGEFTKTTDQTPAAINTAYALTFDNTEISNGVVIGGTTSQIIVPESGLYQFDVTIQITSGNSSDKDVWVWLRKNGTNVPNTARLVTINVNGGYIPVTLINFFSLAASDYIEVMFAADDTAITIDNVASTAFAPAAPAVTLAVTQIQQ